MRTYGLENSKISPLTLPEMKRYCLSFKRLKWSDYIYLIWMHDMQWNSIDICGEPIIYLSGLSMISAAIFLPLAAILPAALLVEPLPYEWHYSNLIWLEFYNLRKAI